MSTHPSDSWTALILAAGEGTRMKSSRPKVLHEIAGRALVSWVVQAALDAGASHCRVVVGYGAEQVQDELKRFGDQLDTVLQPDRRGTGDAVRCAVQGDAALHARVAVMYGDCPLLPAPVLRRLVAQAREAGAECGLMTARLANPSGYGRIVRNESGAVSRIVEDRDCTDAEHEIEEVNPGVYTFRTAFLDSALRELQPNNAQQQLYLTDVVELAARRGRVVDMQGDMATLIGVNDQVDLAVASTSRRRAIAEGLAREGVRIQDLDTAYVDADCRVEPGAALSANVHLKGRCIVRGGAQIGTGTVLTNCVVERDANILPYTVATDSSIGEGAQVGPFSHLRPQSALGPRSKVGNFSETKNTSLGPESKVNHLSYVGDGVIGSRVNVGAGTIFCNYDGERKHTTRLEDDVFIGSDSQLVAPVTVKRGAYVASGTTVTRDVPEDALAVARVRQENKEGYAARLRARLRRKKA